MAFNFFSRFSPSKKKPTGPDRTVPQTPGIGSLIEGRYRLDAEIGRGGMGIVYRAHDLPNHRQVAVKVINVDKADAAATRQFSRESEILTCLQHPHIVAVYETGAVNAGGRVSLPYIVMELVQGVSLDEMGGLTFRSILEIGMQICEALEAAHSQGILYRDLKPENVLVERRGFRYFAKLTDFGVAHPLDMDDADPDGSVMGTFFYLAPELIAGRPAAIASDLYALGATLYEMITGRVPFSDFDKQTVLTQHLEAPVPPPSHSRADLPPGLEEVVLRLMAKDPRERFASARQVIERLEQIAARIGGKGGGNLTQAPAGAAAQEQVEQVIRLLETGPFVTLLGGGRDLLLQTGARLTGQFPDGVWWVTFEAVDDPALVLPAVAQTFGISPDPNRSLTVQLVEQLHEKKLLLLLDQCTHHPGACARLAGTLLNTCPDLYILVTSRQPLDLPAEKCYTSS